MTTITPEMAVFGSEKFNRSLRAIQARSLEADFPGVQWQSEVAAVDWPFLLLCASSLTTNRSERAQEAVLRVTAGCLASEDAGETEKQAAAALLERVGNRRSAELAEQRGYIETDSWLELSPQVRFDTIRSRISYSLDLSNGSTLAVNPFQTELWREAEKSDWLSVSAPTSAGKSRIVREWFLEFLREKPESTLVYLVPTRALIEEVSADFRRETDEGTAVLVLPWDPNLEQSKSRIFVVTQERLQLIQDKHHRFVVDLLFVDEAQSLAGMERGVLLQQVIDRVSSDNPDGQVIFASPLSSNPEILLSGHPATASSSSVASEVVTVTQNLLRVESMYRRPSRRTLSIVDGDVQRIVGEFELASRPTHVPMRLAYPVFAMAGHSTGNLVYVNTASEAENVAKLLFELLGDESHVDEDLADLIDLVRVAVHPRYALADVLARGVAFHYGNMPLLVRTKIERLFRSGKIRYLVCTSTLLEGVNLPCRNIFLRNPKKGAGNPLSRADFWNRAGRAGRWGQEFSGNIVCIDTDVDGLWENLPTRRLRSTLTRAVPRELATADRLLDFLSTSGAVSRDAGAEHLFSYLCTRSSAGDDLEPLFSLLPTSEARHQVSAAVASAVEECEFADALLWRHSGISPLAMQRLLVLFRTSGVTFDDLALPLPEEDDARARFQAAFVRLGAVMTNAFGFPADGVDRRKHQLANLIVNWMRGMPLARLIDQRMNQGILAAKAIRDVMADIETVARFQAPKYLSCYSDLLDTFAHEQGVQRAGAGVDFTMLLELGVSRPSEVVMMSLGLSRTATVAISPYVTADSWTTVECLQWLGAQNLAGLNVPVLVQREVEELLAAPPTYAHKQPTSAGDASASTP